MHDKVLVLSDDEMSDSEENPLIDDVLVSEPRRKPSTANMRHRIFFLSIVFLVLLSIHILIFNNLKVYNRREIPGWSHNTSRETTDYILPNDTTIIEPPTLCREPDPIFLLIVVCSSVNNFEARQSIRESWGNTTEFNYPMFEKFHGALNGSYLNINYKHWRKYVQVRFSSHDNDDHTHTKRKMFIIQISFRILRIPQPINRWILVTFEYVSCFCSVSPTMSSNIRLTMSTTFMVRHELELFWSSIDFPHPFHPLDDIIQENFVDSYNNLTLKTILMLKWANNNCVNKGLYNHTTRPLLTIMNYSFLFIFFVLPVFYFLLSFSFFFYLL